MFAGTECPICLDVMVDPVTTPCGHNLCLGCLRRLPTRVCPVCRADLPPPPAWRVNTGFRDLIEALARAGYLEPAVDSQIRTRTAPTPSSVGPGAAASMYYASPPPQPQAPPPPPPPQASAPGVPTVPLAPSAPPLDVRPVPFGSGGAAAAAAGVAPATGPTWAHFLGRCAVSVASDERTRNFSAEFKGRLMRDWTGLVTAVSKGGLFNPPCLYVRMDPSEAKHTEADIKLIVPDALSDMLRSVTPGMTLVFSAEFLDIGYWFHHEMRLVAYQALPRVPRPRVTLEDFRAVSDLPHDARVRAFYTDYYGRELRTGVTVRENMRPESMNFDPVRVPVECGTWTGTLEVPKRLLTAVARPLPLKLGDHLVVELRFEGMNSLKVLSLS